MRRWMIVALALVTLSEAVAADPVVVVSAGTGEKRLLQVAATAPGPQHADLVLDVRSTVEVMGQKMDIDSPPVTAGLDVEGRAGVGSVALAFAYRDVRVGEGDALAKMTADKMAAGMTGIRGTMKIGSGGEILEQSTTGGSGPTSAKQDLEIWIPRLPTQPVGTGAVWTVTGKETDDHGLVWDQKTTYTLVSLEASRATIGITTEKRTGAGTMTVENMSVPVQSIVTTGNGTSVLLFDRPFPEAGAWHLDVVMQAILSGAPMKETTRLDLKLGTTR